MLLIMQKMKSKVFFPLIAVALWVFPFSAYSKVPKTAVVIVDMQDRFLQFVNPKIRDSLTREILTLLEWAHREEVPVLDFNYRNWGPTTDRLKDYLDKMEKVQVILKHTDDGFLGDVGNEAKLVLDNWGAEHLIMSGVNANACVHDTAEGALARGFSVWTAATLAADSSSTEYPHKTWWLTWSKKFHGKNDLPSLFEALATLLGEAYSL